MGHEGTVTKLSEDQLFYLMSRGLGEDEAMAMIVLPLVGFDSAGQRLGMGGGWYDRSLAFRRDHASPPPWLVGTGFAVQQVDALRAEPWDVSLDAICTESGTFNLHIPPT